MTAWKAKVKIECLGREKRTECTGPELCARFMRHIYGQCKICKRAYSHLNVRTFTSEIATRFWITQQFIADMLKQLTQTLYNQGNVMCKVYITVKWWMTSRLYRNFLTSEIHDLPSMHWHQRWLKTYNKSMQLQKKKKKRNIFTATMTGIRKNPLISCWPV